MNKMTLKKTVRTKKTTHQKMKYRTAVFFSLFTLMVPVKTWADNLEANTLIRVNVIAEACDIRPGDENIQLDFGVVIKKYLYINTRTHSKPFVIHLINCDPVIAKTLTVTLTGKESTVLPGYLAFDASSTAKGAAIGLENSAGALLPINRNSNDFSVPAGALTLNYQAFVQGEPMAISNANIVAGNFSATAIFSLEYN